MQAFVLLVDLLRACTLFLVSCKRVRAAFHRFRVLGGCQECVCVCFPAGLTFPVVRAVVWRVETELKNESGKNEVC